MCAPNLKSVAVVITEIQKKGQNLKVYVIVTQIMTLLTYFCTAYLSFSAVLRAT